MPGMGGHWLRLAFVSGVVALGATHAVEPPMLRIDSSLVLIPVHVTTATGASVTGLTRDSFRVSEDHVEQTISSFLLEDAPVSIGFLLDASGSMRAKLPKAAEAAAAFFRTINPEDESFLIEFGTKAKLKAPFTRNSNQIYRQIAHMAPAGKTTLLDAIHLALIQMKKAAYARKAIVILSDGGDNWSRHSAREVRNQLIESDVQLYAMGIFDSVRAHTREERNGPRLLDDLAEQSGGRLYTVEELDQLPAISTRIAHDLRNQYMLGYYSTNAARDGKYRRVTVRLAVPNVRELRTSYRRGYYAPAE
jgi:Ca-activated chloride channel family protein